MTPRFAGIWDCMFCPLLCFNNLTIIYIGVTLNIGKSNDQQYFQSCILCSFLELWRFNVIYGFSSLLTFDQGLCLGLSPVSCIRFGEFTGEFELYQTCSSKIGCEKALFTHN